MYKQLKGVLVDACERYEIPLEKRSSCIKSVMSELIFQILFKWILCGDMDTAPRNFGLIVVNGESIECAPCFDMELLFDYDDVNINGLIDPQPIIDNGRVFMLVGSFHGNYLVELNADGMALLGGADYQNRNKVLIAGVPLAEEIFDCSYYEGGYIVKKDNYYYFFGSAGTCCEGKSSTYRVYVGRAESIKGPYYAPDGKDLATNNFGNTIGKLALWCPPGVRNTAAPGHNSILIDDAGDYWIIYHGYCDGDDFKTRHLFMDKLAWGEDGFPYVSYSYTDDNGETKTTNIKPSYQIELDGPRFILE